MMNRKSTIAIVSVALLSFSLLPLAAPAQNGRLREQMMQRRASAGMAQSGAPVTLPQDSRVMRDVAYGNDPRQRFDVYIPAHASAAPVIFMVHGGGWRRGDKANRGVIQNKIDRWLPRGFIVISANYRMRPDTAPLQQAQDVARALAQAQRDAASWGGDPASFILMGHSSGAHLVALLTAEPALAKAQGAQPWLGTVSLDNATLNVVQTMESPHLGLYDEAFGAQPADWLAASPYQQMHGETVPILAVCSSRRKDSCPQAHAFVREAASLGSRARVVEEDLSHGEINAQLGLPSAYTDAVEQFMRTLSPDVAERLGQATAPVAPLSGNIDH